MSMKGFIRYDIFAVSPEASVGLGQEKIGNFKFRNGQVAPAQRRDSWLFEDLHV
jgi:hypothetical protein